MHAPALDPEPSVALVVQNIRNIAGRCTLRRTQCNLMGQLLRPTATALPVPALSNPIKPADFCATQNLHDTKKECGGRIFEPFGNLLMYHMKTLSVPFELERQFGYSPEPPKWWKQTSK